MAERTEDVTLTVAGERHEGWTAVSVTRALDTLSGAFTLDLTDRWAGRETSFALEAGAACTVSISGETVITGWIDRLAPRIEGESHGLTITGRDRTGDLIDCSAIAKPGSWRDASIEAIAAELAQPFGVAVHAAASTGPKLRRFAIQQGETVQAAIERLCRFAGLLAITDARGDLLLTVPATGAPVERIVEGVDILGGGSEFDVSGRFSSYLVKGQSAGDDHVNGKAAAAPSGSAGDPAVRRYRPLLVVAEEQTTLANAQVRARWEASTRTAKGSTVRVTLPGWRTPAGKLRAPNTLVAIEAPRLLARGTMLVQDVELSKDERGTVSELTLVPPEAWSQLAVPETAEPSRVGRKKAA